jgi:hypothetical protein
MRTLSCTAAGRWTPLRKSAAVPTKSWVDLSWTFVLEPDGIDKMHFRVRTRGTVSPRWYG